MSISLNNITLVGRLGRDPEVKYFESGSVVCKFTLAVNARRKDDPPSWFDVECWAKTAEIAATYLKKGSLAGIEGALVLETWKDTNSGASRSKPVVRCENLTLLGSRADNNSSGTDYNIEF